MPNTSILNLLWLQLAAMIFVDLICHINCFDSLPSADVAHASNDAQHNTHDLINPNLGKAVRQSSNSQSNSSNQESRSRVTKMAKFDLNELPGDEEDTAVDDYHFKKNSDLRSDIDSSHASKRPRLVPYGLHSSSMAKNVNSPEINLSQINTGLKITFDHSLSAQKLRYVDQYTSLELFKPSPAQTTTIRSSAERAYLSPKATGSSNQRHMFEESKIHNTLIFGLFPCNKRNYSIRNIATFEKL
ncbi:hypothetical protein BY996DRAFT_6418718 [Phakopsora pachyrhizi]|nr:hypothetical protein BY996DRAFT_6418718 [Phakopsora pachyrhizi]